MFSLSSVVLYFFTSPCWSGVGVRSGPGAARTILLFHTISARPPKQPLMVRTFLKVHTRPISGPPSVKPSGPPGNASVKPSVKPPNRQHVPVVQAQQIPPLRPAQTKPYKLEGPIIYEHSEQIQGMPRPPGQPAQNPQTLGSPADSGLSVQPGLGDSGLDCVTRTESDLESLSPA